MCRQPYASHDTSVHWCFDDLSVDYKKTDELKIVTHTTPMMETRVKVTILGTAQDAGIPQAGCSCKRCINAHNFPEYKKYPVSIGIEGCDGSKHLLEITRNLPEQLKEWSGEVEPLGIFVPETVTITHLHLGHIEGIGQFGKPVMNTSDLPIYLSEKNRESIEQRNDIQLMIKERNIKFEPQKYNHSFQPKEDCGFKLRLIPIPHRSELGDTAGIIIEGKKKNLLFLPDQDSWEKTLESFSVKDIRELFTLLEIDIAWIDGTFWNLKELPGRNLKEIPHPIIEESLELLGMRRPEDPEVSFIHLNHSNPVNDNDSMERKLVQSRGWSVCERNQTVTL